jgi:hypothetical protein
MDYANGKIYKITGGGMTYYGSTTQPLSKRFYGHKSKKNYNHTLSSKIIETGEAVIVLVELFPCKSKDELFSRERFWIENNECINKIIPLQTYKEYCEKNKEKIKETKKIYYENNKEHLSNKHTEWINNNIEKIKEYNKKKYVENKEENNLRLKIWRENNKEKLRQYNKRYREKKKGNI